MKLILKSCSRYSAGRAHKQDYGSATITTFKVFWDSRANHFYVSSAGATPGNRKTSARKLAEKLISLDATHNHATELTAAKTWKTYV